MKNLKNSLFVRRVLIGSTEVIQPQRKQYTSVSHVDMPEKSSKAVKVHEPQKRKWKCKKCKTIVAENDTLMWQHLKDCQKIVHKPSHEVLLNYFEVCAQEKKPAVVNPSPPNCKSPSKNTSKFFADVRYAVGQGGGHLIGCDFKCDYCGNSFPARKGYKYDYKDVCVCNECKKKLSHKKEGKYVKLEYFPVNKKVSKFKK